jgi:NADH-quinone oxidoreductase subunit C
MDMVLPPSRTWAEKGWDPGTAAERLAESCPGAVLEKVEFRGETTLLVAFDQLGEVLAFLRDDPSLQFDFLTDVTAVHWPARPEPFDIVYQLYSFPRNVRLRVKARLGADAGTGSRVPSVVSLWPAAGWLERECFDMFGIVFDDHPDLRRILMPEDFDGYPLRKEFPLKC